MPGESILALYRTHDGKFRTGTKGRERKGSGWFGEQRAKENRGAKGIKDAGLTKPELVSRYVCNALYEIRAVCPVFSLNFTSDCIPG